MEFPAPWTILIPNSSIIAISSSLGPKCCQSRGFVDVHPKFIPKDMGFPMDYNDPQSSIIPWDRIPYNPKTYFYINIIIWNPKDMHPYYIQYQYLSMLCIQLDGVTPCNSHQPARVIHAAKSRRSRPAGCRPRSPRRHRQWAPPRFLRLLAELTYPRNEKCLRKSSSVTIWVVYDDVRCAYTYMYIDKHVYVSIYIQAHR